MENNDYSKNEKFSLLLTKIMIVFLSICIIMIIVLTYLNAKINNGTLSIESINSLKNISNILGIIILSIAIINVFLLFMIMFLNPDDPDYNKYKDYVFVSKKDIKEFRNEYIRRERNLKKDIRNLKKIIKNKK